MTASSAEPATTCGAPSPGNAIAAGGAGNDLLVGGAGRAGNDLLLGGARPGTLVSRDSSRDVVRCGAGKDQVVADKRDSVAKDCERVTRK